ncbi:MAG: hypothetical protein K2K52_07235, partial [Paramuribaculum sp.]|nr:hypothetical protein [Paramuribaculum sp.]
LDYMLYCVIERAKAIFLERGGIKEEMYRARIAYRAHHQPSDNYNFSDNHHSHQSYHSHQNTNTPPSDTSDSSAL